jgi:hypothetical protein
MTNQESSTINAELKAGLAMHTGSEVWYRHWTNELVYTEGIEYLADKAKAYWLIDLVASWRIDARIRNEPFIVWKLTVNADRTAVAVADDGDGRELARQVITWTDFPLDEVSLYLTDGTLLLPGEY